MSEQGMELWIRRYLARATRHGVYASAATRLGVPLPMVQDEFRLAAEAIDQIVHDVTSTDVSRWVNALYVKRMDTITLDTTGLFKLRAVLLLGLGEARYLKPDERRLALVRTYRISPLSGENEALGARQFRNRTSDLYRAERGQLLDEIARLVAGSLSGTSADQAVTTSSSASAEPRADYRILDYDDQHVYPASGAHDRFVIRRRTIMALRDGVSQFRAQYTLTSVRGEMPVPKVVGVGRLSTEHERVHEENGETGRRYDLVIDFPALKKGQTRVLQWIVQRDQQPTRAGGTGIQIAGVTPAVNIDHATIAIHFDSSVTPSRCWRFDSVSPGDARLEDSASADLTPDDGYVVAEWAHLSVGRASGIAWRW